MLVEGFFSCFRRRLFIIYLNYEEKGFLQKVEFYQVVWNKVLAFLDSLDALEQDSIINSKVI